MQITPPFKKAKLGKTGFTLIELLIVIAIILILSTFLFAVVKRGMLAAHKTQTLNTLRSVETGIAAFMAEYNKPPLPDAIIADGKDIVFGKEGGDYSNAYIVAVLEGLGPDDTSTDFSYDGADWKIESVNKSLEEYAKFPRSANKKNGVFEKEDDADNLVFYDAWNKPIMICLNVPPFSTESNNGVNDELCFTDGAAEYTDSKPKAQPYVSWSYGKDGVKGTANGEKSDPTYKGSDDVITW